MLFTHYGPIDKPSRGGTELILIVYSAITMATSRVGG
jgi:hypothetical protein